LFIPGLDEAGGAGGKRDGNIFDIDTYDPDGNGEISRVKKFKAPHE